MDKEMVKVTIRLPKDVIQAGKAAAMAQGRDFQDLVRDALMLYFQHKVKKTLAEMGRQLIAAGRKGGKQ